MEPLSSHDQIQIRKPLQKLASSILGHTSHDPYHEIGVRLLSLGQIARFANGFLLCLVPDAAGIQ